MLTKASHLPLSWVRRIQFKHSNPITLRSILKLLSIYPKAACLPFSKANICEILYILMYFQWITHVFSKENVAWLSTFGNSQKYTEIIHLYTTEKINVVQHDVIRVLLFSYYDDSDTLWKVKVNSLSSTKTTSWSWMEKWRYSPCILNLSTKQRKEVRFILQHCTYVKCVIVPIELNVRLTLEGTWILCRKERPLSMLEMEHQLFNCTAQSLVIILTELSSLLIQWSCHI